MFLIVNIRIARWKSFIVVPSTHPHSRLPASSCIVLEIVVLERIAGGPGTGRDAEFAIDRLHVDVDGMRTQDKLLGNLAVGQPLGNQAQHFGLAPGQAPGRSQCWGHE